MAEKASQAEGIAGCRPLGWFKDAAGRIAWVSNHDYVETWRDEFTWIMTCTKCGDNSVGYTSLGIAQKEAKGEL
jgi:hypothetical protein